MVVVVVFFFLEGEGGSLICRQFLFAEKNLKAQITFVINIGEYSLSLLLLLFLE